LVGGRDRRALWIGQAAGRVAMEHHDQLDRRAPLGADHPYRGREE
jgi:hypothetical protein